MSIILGRWVIQSGTLLAQDFLKSSTRAWLKLNDFLGRMCQKDQRSRGQNRTRTKNVGRKAGRIEQAKSTPRSGQEKCRSIGTRGKYANFEYQFLSRRLLCWLTEKCINVMIFNFVKLLKKKLNRPRKFVFLRISIGVDTKTWLAIRTLV